MGGKSRKSGGVSKQLIDRLIRERKTGIKKSTDKKVEKDNESDLLKDVE